MNGDVELKLDKLQETKIDIRLALLEKGVSVPVDTPFSQYPDKISTVSGLYVNTEIRENITLPFDYQQGQVCFTNGEEYYAAYTIGSVGILIPLSSGLSGSTVNCYYIQYR